MSCQEELYKLCNTLQTAAVREGMVLLPETLFHATLQQLAKLAEDLTPTPENAPAPRKFQINQPVRLLPWPDTAPRARRFGVVRAWTNGGYEVQRDDGYTLPMDEAELAAVPPEPPADNTDLLRDLGEMLNEHQSLADLIADLREIKWRLGVSNQLAAAAKHNDRIGELLARHLPG